MTGNNAKFMFLATDSENATLVTDDFSISDTYAYPNPVFDQCRIKATFTSSSLSSAVVDIFTIQGNRIYSGKMDKVEDTEYEIAWQTEDVAPGIYYYTITAIEYGNSKEHTSSGKIAVVK